MRGDLRLFVAVPVPSEVSLLLGPFVEALRRAFREHGWRVSWSLPEELHVTLKFLGDVPEARLGAIQEALSVLCDSEPVALGLGPLQSFSRRGTVSTWFLPVTMGTEYLLDSVSRLELAFATQGFARERRAFHPHVTLGRVREPGTMPARVDLPLLPCEGTTWLARSAALFRSHLGKGAPRYERLHSVAFGRSEAGTELRGDEFCSKQTFSSVT